MLNCPVQEQTQRMKFTNADMYLRSMNMASHKTVRYSRFSNILILYSFLSHIFCSELTPLLEITDTVHTHERNKSAKHKFFYTKDIILLLCFLVL